MRRCMWFPPDHVAFNTSAQCRLWVKSGNQRTTSRCLLCAISRHAGDCTTNGSKLPGVPLGNLGQPLCRGESNWGPAWLAGGRPRSSGPCPPCRARGHGRGLALTKSAIFPRKMRSTVKPGSLTHTSAPDRSSTSQRMRNFVRLAGTPENSKRTTTRRSGNASRIARLRKPHSKMVGSRSVGLMRSRA